MKTFKDYLEEINTVNQAVQKFNSYNDKEFEKMTKRVRGKATDKDKHLEKRYKQAKNAAYKIFAPKT